MDDREAIRELIRRINEAWLNRRMVELDHYFHEAMVGVAPGFQARSEGREACIKSYEDFMGAAVVDEFRESEPTIDLCGNTAVATFGWEMAWTMNGRSHRESGHDLFVFTREDGRWWTVWRTMLPTPAKGQ
jgi:hypothetical protein